ncbi:CIS tube protein [Streptomyces cadmiisoli]|uniref:CIS tube protein n=1 Tax=Streptomyces cadmiisoli TaxID=2184053 RepID=UPI00365289B1
MTVSTGSSLQRNVSRAVLRSLTGDEFPFEYNPTEITISHNDEGLADPVGRDGRKDDHSIVSSIATRGSTRLVMSTLTFTGEDIQHKIELLLEWVTEDTVTRSDGTKEKGKRERLRFQWGTRGSGFDYEVELMRFDCTYTRFARGGRPVRAEVRNLTLHVLSHTGATPTPAGTGGTAPAVSDGGPAGLPPGTAPDANADPTRTLLKKGNR